MKIFKWLGWIVLPFIMIFIQWKKLRVGPKVIGVLWSLWIAKTWLFLVIGTSQTPMTVALSAENHPQPTTHNARSYAVRPTEKEKLEAELRKIQQHKVTLSPEQQIEFVRQLFKYDKYAALKLEPSVLDAGFAGYLFVQTDKNTVQTSPAVGNALVSRQANGVYWLVQVTINNAGKYPLTVDSSMFSLVTKDGHIYASDRAAELLLMNHKPFMFDTVNPNMDVTGYLVFDVPVSMKMSDVSLVVRNGLSGLELKIN